MSIRNMTVGAKVWALCLFFLSALVSLGVLMHFIVGALEREIVLQEEKLVPAVRLAGQIDMYHDGIRAVAMSAAYYATNTERVKGLRDEAAEMQKNFKDSLTALAAAGVSEDITKLVNSALPVAELYSKESTKVIDAIVSGNNAVIAQEMAIFEKQFEQLTVSLDALGSRIEKFADVSGDQSRVIANTARLQEVTFVLVASLVGLLLSWFIASSIVHSLRSTVDQIASEAKALRDIGGGLDISAEKLSESTTEQAAAIEQTVSSMEEMTAMLAQTSQHASTSLDVADNGVEEANRGNDVADRMIIAMGDIQEANKKLERLVALIAEIESKTKVINDIVFETRLLSFNASIEAARAGVHGKGFAVVAEEVGKLAAMSGKAADEIRVLLESSTREVAAAVDTTQEKVAVGQQVSQECRDAFKAMDVTLKKIGESVKSIASAAKEQEVGVQQTNKAMNEMDKTTQINSGSAETLAGNAKKLAEVIGKLDESVKEVGHMVRGGAAQIKKVVTPKKIAVKVEKKKAPVVVSEAAPVFEPIASSKPSVKEEKKESKAEVKSDDLMAGVGRNDSRWSA